jgi:hypothetical protein
MSSHQLQTEIDITATPERVWSILTNFPAYPDWNPFIRSIRGAPEQGAPLEIRIQPSGTKGMTFRPTVLTAIRAQELRWLGRFLVPGLFDGEHRFVIKSLANGKVRFQQSELFNGILVPIFRASLDRDTKRGFEEMNQALKVRAEANEAPNKAMSRALQRVGSMPLMCVSEIVRGLEIWTQPVSKSWNLAAQNSPGGYATSA